MLKYFISLFTRKRRGSRRHKKTRCNKSCRMKAKGKGKRGKMKGG